MRSLRSPKEPAGTASDDHIFEIRHRGEGPRCHLPDQALDLGSIRVAAFDVEADDCLTDPGYPGCRQEGALQTWAAPARRRRARPADRIHGGPDAEGPASPTGRTPKEGLTG
jgi:hypothetical protein